jgi:hypothetical protein
MNVSNQLRRQPYDPVRLSFYAKKKIQVIKKKNNRSVTYKIFLLDKGFVQII